MRVLITGATGLLGKALVETRPVEVVVSGTCRFPSRGSPFLPMNVCNESQILAVFELVEPDVVIHTASIGSVDYAEQNRERTWAVNVGGTQNVAEMCHYHRAKLIFVSSNAVFNGEDPPYAEDAPVNPVNQYGHLKVEAEHWARSSGNCAIVRPILMYGWPNPGERDNWVTTWIRELSAGRKVQVVDDTFSNPLYARDCARAIWAVVTQNRTGTYHVAGADRVSLYAFAFETARMFYLDPALVEPVASSYFPEIAPRPRDTTLDTTKMEQELGLCPRRLLDGLMLMRRTRDDD